MAIPDYTSDIPYGYCHCGCGRKTQLIKGNCQNRDEVKGEPRFYLRGHSVRNDYDQFWSKVAITADTKKCWLWQGNFSSNGYGRMQINNVMDSSHRIAWSYPDYIIPDGMEICHTCDNPECCNPSHLFLGTHQDNMLDMINKKRNAVGETLPQSKLNSSDVIAIRNRFELGGITRLELAIQYGVRVGAIGKIIRGERWKHLL